MIYEAWTADKPIVSVTITDDDTLFVTVYGIHYPTPEGMAPLTQSSMGALMDHLYSRLDQPFSVEIIGPHDSYATGWIDLDDAHDGVVRVPVTAYGLTPGEEVCLAYVVAETVATQMGTAGFRVDDVSLSELLTGEVAILGRATHASTLHQLRV